jgi:hypothetical protein
MTTPDVHEVPVTREGCRKAPPVFVTTRGGTHFAAESAEDVALVADMANVTVEPTSREVLAARIGLIAADHPQLWSTSDLVRAYNRDLSTGFWLG